MDLCKNKRVENRWIPWAVDSGEPAKYCRRQRGLNPGSQEPQECSHQASTALHRMGARCPASPQTGCLGGPLRMVWHQLKTMSGRQAPLPTPPSASVLLCGQVTWACMPALLCTVCTSSGKSGNLSEPRLSHLQNADNHTLPRGAVRIQVRRESPPRR